MQVRLSRSLQPVGRAGEWWRGRTERVQVPCALVRCRPTSLPHASSLVCYWLAGLSCELRRHVRARVGAGGLHEPFGSSTSARQVPCRLQGAQLTRQLRAKRSLAGTRLVHAVQLAALSSAPAMPRGVISTLYLPPRDSPALPGCTSTATSTSHPSPPFPPRLGRKLSTPPPPPPAPPPPLPCYVAADLLGHTRTCTTPSSPRTPRHQPPPPSCF